MRRNRRCSVSLYAWPLSRGAPLEMVKLLVESGSPVNQWAQNPGSFHVDHYLSAFNLSGHVLFDALNDSDLKPDSEVIKYLLSQGARDEAFEYCGEETSAYDRAVERGLTEIAELLAPAFVAYQPTDESSNDEQSGDEQSDDAQP